MLFASNYEACDEGSYVEEPARAQRTNARLGACMLRRKSLEAAFAEEEIPCPPIQINDSRAGKVGILNLACKQRDLNFLLFSRASPGTSGTKAIITAFLHACAA